MDRRRGGSWNVDELHHYLRAKYPVVMALANIKETDSPSSIRDKQINHVIAVTGRRIRGMGEVSDGN